MFSPRPGMEECRDSQLQNWTVAGQSISHYRNRCLTACTGGEETCTPYTDPLKKDVHLTYCRFSPLPNNQEWLLRDVSFGDFFEIVSAQSNTCLTWGDERLLTYKCSANHTQLWSFNVLPWDLTT